MLLGAFWTLPEGFLGLHVGSCWHMLGICWFKVDSSWLQDGSRSVYVGSSWPQDAQNGPQKASQVPQYEAKMAPRWLPNGYVLVSWSFFRDLLPDLRFPMFFFYSGALKHQCWSIFVANFDDFWIMFGILGRVGPKTSQDTLMIAAGWPT